MAKTRDMTSNQNNDALTRKRVNICDKSGVAPWSDLNHDVVYLVMMRLGVIDFIAFSGVCKSWRSFAVCNRNKFMASRPPMYMSIWYAKDYLCRLEDLDGRTFKTIIPHSAGRECVGLTCGYLVLFGRETKDFWLVNPITRHELYFPSAPVCLNYYLGRRAIMVFSTSLSGWLFVFLDKFSHKIWFSLVGKGVWNYVSFTFPIHDILAFKGKIYAIGVNMHNRVDVGHLCELRLDPEPKLMLLKTKNFPKTCVMLPEFLSYGENLYLNESAPPDFYYKAHELDFGDMKWVCPDDITKEEYEIFISRLCHSSALKRESWWPRTGKNRQGWFTMARLRFFPHEYFNVNFID